MSSLSKMAHADATTKSFVEGCLATTVSYLCSEVAFGVIKFSYAHVEGTVVQDVDVVQNVIARLIYAVTCTLTCTLLGWLLRDRANVDVSEGTVVGDWLMLVHACVPMLIAWSWRDLAAMLLTCLDTYESINQIDDALVGLTLIVMLSLAEWTPCYQQYKAAVDERGSGDTVFARLVGVPGSFTLAIGYCVNQGFAEVVTHAQNANNVSSQPALSFLIQLAYFIIVFLIIVTLTARFLAWSSANDLQRDVSSHNIVVHTIAMEKVGGHVLVSAMSFVAAWALSDTCNSFFFVYMVGCSSATTCAYQSNFVYSLLITVIFSYFATLISYEQRKSAKGKAYQSLITTAMSLSVGWAWQNFAYTVVVDFRKDIPLLRPTFAFMAVLGIWCVLACILYHGFMAEQRAWESQRRAQAVFSSASDGEGDEEVPVTDEEATACVVAKENKNARLAAAE